MLENFVNKREIFKGEIHTPRSADLSLRTEPEQDSRKEVMTSRQMIERRTIEVKSIEISQKKKKQPSSRYIWKTRALRIIYFVSKFLTNLKQNTDKIKFKMITKKIFSVISDSSSDFEYYATRRMVDVNMSLIRLLRMQIHQSIDKIPINISSLIPILYPDSYFRILFDTLLVLTVILNIFYIPLNLAFDVESDENFIVGLLLDEIPSWLLFMEIVLNFNTAFYFEGIIHTHRSSIIKHYFRGQLFWDLLIAIPFAVSKINSTFTNYILLFRVARVKEKFDNIEKTLNLREKFSGLLDLLRLVFFVLVVSHFCACLWYYIAMKEEQSGENSWLSKNNIAEASIQTRYINSLYFCTITITTVGYGDITPSTNTERIFTVFMTLITCGVFGYAINNIGTIFQEMERKQQSFKNQMAKINLHLKRHRISQPIALQIRKYFEFFFQRMEEDDKEILQWFSHLPHELGVQLQIDKYKKILLRSKFFRENLSISCINDLCLKVSEIQYSPDDIIFKRNESTRTIYFLYQGEVKIVFQKKNLLTNEIRKGKLIQDTVLRKFKQGYVLGEKNFLLDREMDYQANASQQCVMIQITFDDFIETLRNHPEDLEGYQLMRDTLQLNQTFRRVVSVCEICGHNHSFKGCPFPFFQPNRHKIVQKLQRSEPQSRRLFKRTHTNKVHQESDIAKICAITVAFDYGFLNEDEVGFQNLLSLGIDLNKQKDQMILLYSNKSNQTSNDLSSNRSIVICPQYTKGEQRRQSAIQRMKTLANKVTFRNEQTVDIEEQDQNTASKAHLSFQNRVKSLASKTSNKLGRSSKFNLPDDNDLYAKDFEMDIILANFDKFKIYQIYKPVDNLHNVLQNLQQLRQRSRPLIKPHSPIGEGTRNDLLNKFFNKIKGHRYQLQISETHQE